MKCKKLTEDKKDYVATNLRIPNNVYKKIKIELAKSAYRISQTQYIIMAIIDKIEKSSQDELKGMNWIDIEKQKPNDLQPVMFKISGSLFYGGYKTGEESKDNYFYGKEDIKGSYVETNVVKFWRPW